jgi:hypothetical protein
VTALKIPARALEPGDKIGSGETVIRVSTGIRTPSGKVDVALSGPGEKRRSAVWGARTLINVKRP